VLIEPAAFSIPLDVVEWIPESVARENLILPVKSFGQPPRGLAVVAAQPADVDLLQKLEFILNRVVHLLPARRERIEAEINHYYGMYSTESVDCILYEFP
jgi:hypothetical protein